MSDRIEMFIATPGDMGEAAPWKETTEIRDYFYEKIRERLEAETGREVRMVIEKERLRAGPIHRSMVDAANDADVYIADLTGNTPNLYLELAVARGLLARKENTAVSLERAVALDPRDARRAPGLGLHLGAQPHR